MCMREMERRRERKEREGEKREREIESVGVYYRSLLIMWSLITLLHSAPHLSVDLIVSLRKSLSLSLSLYLSPSLSQSFLVNQNNIQPVWLLWSPYVII